MNENVNNYCLQLYSINLNGMEICQSTRYCGMDQASARDHGRKWTKHQLGTMDVDE
jgi:hypothetical protein